MKKAALVISILFTMCFAVMVSAEDAPDAATIFNDMVKNTAGLKTYTFSFEYENVSGKKREWRQCSFMFNTRDFMRLEVLDGDDKGGKVAYNVTVAKDKVTAQKGFLKLKLSVDDERMQGFLASDWNSDTKEISELAKGAAFTNNGPEKIGDRNTTKITIITKSGKYDKIELWIDAKEKLLIQYKYYEKGKYHSSKTYYDINMKPTLKNDDFKP